MVTSLYQYRFEILLVSQLLVLFGGLIFPVKGYDSVVSPILFSVNLLASIFLFLKQKKKLWMVIFLLGIALFALSLDAAHFENQSLLNNLRLFSFFLFYILLTSELILQIMKAEVVSKNVIFGTISGYLSLGLIGFFICLSIESFSPGAFKGLTEGVLGSGKTEDLIYYSFITLTTIGYGEIVPAIPSAKKAAVLIGLLGQFYLVIVTAIIVGKYMNQNHS